MYQTVRLENDLVPSAAAGVHHNPAHVSTLGYSPTLLVDSHTPSGGITVERRSSGHSGWLSLRPYRVYIHPTERERQNAILQPHLHTPSGVEGATMIIPMGSKQNAGEAPITLRRRRACLRCQATVCGIHHGGKCLAATLCNLDASCFYNLPCQLLIVVDNE